MSHVTDRTAVQQLAGALLDDVDRIARRSVACMRELLPSYAMVPADELLPETLTNTRNLLGAVRDPDADPDRADDHFRFSGEARLRQGIAADEMLQAWRIGLGVVREAAHPVARRLGVTDAQLLEFVEATLKWGDIGMRRTAAVHREGELRELQRLAAEQAALRRVAMMIARERPPSEVLATVAEELETLFGVMMVRIARFEPDGTATILAARGMPDDVLPEGTNTPRPPGGILDQVLRTGRPGRVDDYAHVTGALSADLRAHGIRAAAAGPIAVDGRTWGAMALASRTSLPLGIEDRLAQFAELVSTAISNVESRAQVKRLVAEQSALRRVAELVARQASSEEVFAVVTEELCRLLDVDLMRTVRFEPDGTATVVAARGTSTDLIPPGTTNIRLPRGTVVDEVLRTARPARVDGYEGVAGPIGALLRTEGARSGAGGPIIVDGRLWGAIAVGSPAMLPPGTEDRVARFGELISTAISNLESRTAVERLAAEQAALRRVAELVARQARPAEVFARATEELALLLDADIVKTVRFEPDGRGTVMATYGVTDNRIALGSSDVIPRGSLIDTVIRTGGTARVDGYARVDGPVAAILRDEGVSCGVGAPLIVEGRLWGAMTILSRTPNAFPAGTEARVTQFCGLISAAISNIESRGQVERLAAEQSALRRVATLVAHEHSPDDLFAALAEEIGVLLGVDGSAVVRFEDDASVTVLAGWSDGAISLPLGERLSLEGESLSGDVQRSGVPRRKEDYSGATGAIAEIVRAQGILCAVASPILVEGATWGMIAALSRRSEALPPETEARLAEFSRHAGIAVANANGRSDLAQSRARIVRAGDEARRRFERDLHDGAQQRLVSLGLELAAAETGVPPDLGDLRQALSRARSILADVLDNLRELSRGLHPAVLSEGGLSPALSALARRSVVPVDLQLRLDGDRFDEPIEVAAYYVASEALANAAKHAQASHVEVTVRERDGWLELIVHDDGTGGAEASRGSGLTGLADRVEVIGGTLELDSPPDAGTTLRARLPTRLVR